MAKAELNPNTLLVMGALGIGSYYLFGDAENGDPHEGEPYTDPDLPPPTMAVSASRVLADRIYAAFYGGGTWGDWGHPGEDEEAAIAALIVPRNTNDVFQLIDAYGVRQSFWSVANALNLAQAVREFMEPDEIHRVNMSYADRGITVRF